MCAQFHPKEDLIVSASLDQSVRVWDMSGLRKKNAVAGSTSFEDQTARQNPQADMFGQTDVVVKYVLEGHDRGVNWVSFHPTMPLIISAGDDRLVKLWRMSETKAWEVDTCRGHFNNASAAIFHPHQDLVLSVGEDKTIRVWDVNKRTAVQTFRRENDRFWVIAAHPEINLFAAGHDNGVMVFKLERERPAHAIHNNMLFYMDREKCIRTYDFTTGEESAKIISLRKSSQQWISPRTMSYNPAERSVLITSASDNGSYELITLPRESGPQDAFESKGGSGSSAIFVARNRFAVLDKGRNIIDIKDLSNSVTKTIQPPGQINDIFYGGSGLLLLCSSSSVVRYDIQQKLSLSEITASSIKYAIWSANGSHVALLGKHTVLIATKNLEQICSIHETLRVKSAMWDDSGVLLYSTLNHIKYTLPSGDNGVIKTLEQPVYLLRTKGNQVIALDRSAKIRTILIDPTEYRFKLALAKRNFDEVLHIIKTSNLVGQSIIAYLQKKGFSEIALRFVEDPQTRFELAIECGDSKIASEMAKEIDRPDVWKKLAQEALSQGNHQIVETCFQRMKTFEKLSFLYLITGDLDKLGRMAKIAEHRGDHLGLFHNSLYLGDVQTRIRMMKEADLYPLAYLTAKTYELNDEAAEILEVCGISEDQIKMLPAGESLNPIAPVCETFKANWVIASAQSIFDPALADKVANLIVGDEGSESNGEFLDAPNVEEADGWDVVGDDLEVEHKGESNDDDVAGSSEADLWVRNSPLAVDHVAAGSFESAMQLLNRQVGVVNFVPLKPYFLNVYQASRTYLPANAGLEPLPNFLRRNKEETDLRKVLPVAVRDIESVTQKELQNAYKAVKSNKLEEAVALFVDILHILLLTPASTKSEEKEIKQLIKTSSHYIVGLSLEVERRGLAADESQVKRNLELAAYFASVDLQTDHRKLALLSAMKEFNDRKNLVTAGFFAEKLVGMKVTGKPAERAKKIMQNAERAAKDPIAIDFDQFVPFEVCAASHTPIYQGAESVKCKYCHASYLEHYKETVCVVCKVAQIGMNATGFICLHK
ncbi:putative coatomer subunit alpha [Neolecta irregularis DAH-3]|uniref:Putative coatomer subunit alpha n=1 Tax=Neolecta irregularis (strain DAH-3) TaxID=1198029 RepID=A0A1U7LIS4_NEOID|nr:putative coatomer subunit alpha [Neolecta irregularis DAH-3]|eukprot:OLL22528.1 putative coatomer subunit alpha [Neolecta irregularis DAH-3]